MRTWRYHFNEFSASLECNHNKNNIEIQNKQAKCEKNPSSTSYAITWFWLACCQACSNFFRTDTKTACSKLASTLHWTHYCTGYFAFVEPICWLPKKAKILFSPLAHFACDPACQIAANSLQDDCSSVQSSQSGTHVKKIYFFNHFQFCSSTFALQSQKHHRIFTS